MAQIRWRKQDEAELQRAVNNFNAKVRRWEKKGLEHLPERESKRQIQDRIVTRQDFNREINRLRRFSRRGAEKPRELESGVVVSEWEYKEMANARRFANINRTYRKKRLQNLFEQEGMSTAKAKATVERNRSNIYKLQVKPEKTARDLTEFHRSFERMLTSAGESVTKTDLQYKKNLIKALDEVFGKDGRFIQKYVKSQSADRLVYLLYTKPETSIEDLYLILYSYSPPDEPYLQMKNYAMSLGMSEQEVQANIDKLIKKNNRRAKRNKLLGR